VETAPILQPANAGRAITIQINIVQLIVLLPFNNHWIIPNLVDSPDKCPIESASSSYLTYSTSRIIEVALCRKIELSRDTAVAFLSIKLHHSKEVITQ
jgi:hypothetical protein